MSAGRRAETGAPQRLCVRPGWAVSNSEQTTKALMGYRQPADQHSAGERSGLEDNGSVRVPPPRGEVSGLLGRHGCEIPEWFDGWDR